MNELIIHPGIHKTGSTALQFFLWSKYEALKDIGVLYPETGRSSIDSIRYGHHEVPWGLIGRQGFNVDIVDSVLAEFKDSNCNRMVLSSEEFGRVDKKGVKIFIDKVSEVFEKIRIVVFVRHQVDVLQGSFGTDIVYNGVLLDIMTYVEQIDIEVDYLVIERLWKEANLEIEVIFCPFDSSIKKGSNLIYSFLSATDLEIPIANWDVTNRKNESLPWYAALTIQHMWRLGWNKDMIYRSIDTFKSILEPQTEGYQFLSPSEAKAIANRYIASNADLATRYPNLAFLCDQQEFGDQRDWENLRAEKFAALFETTKALNTILGNK